MAKSANSNGPEETPKDIEAALPDQLYGRTAAKGHALGRALPVEKELNLIYRQAPEGESREDALHRFDEAVATSKQQLEELQGDPDDTYYDVASLIFSFHRLTLDDDAFAGEMRKQIEAGEGPESAVRSVAQEYARQFHGMGEDRIAEKAQDIRDVGYRLLVNLADADAEEQDFRGRIALVRHIFPSELVRLASERIEGAVLFGSAVTAHITILSRSLGLPVLVTRDRRLFDIPEETKLFLDATEGHLYVNPTGELLKRARETCSIEEEKREKQHEQVAGESGGRTKDGTEVTLLANVNIYNDAVRAKNGGAQGIGLYRSEFPFIIRNEFLTEEQQYRLYRQVVSAFPEGETVLRTVDIGGDKLMAGQEDGERNPFLGVRGIRFSLAYPEQFKVQLRAMLRAGADRRLRIMFPMVAAVDGVRRGRAILDEARLELEREGVPHCTSPEVGAMVELPSAVITIADLARETDFLSIGTNDLIMYMLAVDRTNENLEELYRSHHPTVLRTISMITEGVGEKLSKLSVCGDSAADPLMIPFFLGLGIRTLSMSPAHLEVTRSLLKGLSLDECETIAREMLEIGELPRMDEYLTELEERLAPLVN